MLFYFYCFVFFKKNPVFPLTRFSFFSPPSSFGSRFDSMWKASKKNSTAALREATDYVKRMSANYNGTELLQPIRSIVTNKNIPDYARQMFLLTDGEVRSVFV